MRNRRERVLLAELGDALALSVLRQLYEHNHTFDVLMSRSRDVTHTLLQSERFSVVALRAAQSTPSALVEIRNSFTTPLETRLVAVTDPGSPDVPDVLHAAGADFIVPSSLGAKMVAEQVMTAARVRTGFSGRLEQLGAADLVQMLCVAKRSAIVRLCPDREGAMLWLEHGEIHHAVFRSLRGASAVHEILKLDSGDFSVLTSGRTPVRTIQKAWQHVLLDAAQAQDELGARRTQVNAQVSSRTGEHRAVASAADSDELAQSYRELTEAGLQSLRAGNLSRAREYWDAARSMGQAPDHGEVGDVKAPPTSSPHLEPVAKPA